MRSRMRLRDSFNKPTTSSQDLRRPIESKEMWRWAPGADCTSLGVRGGGGGAGVEVR